MFFFYDRNILFIAVPRIIHRKISNKKKYIFERELGPKILYVKIKITIKIKNKDKKYNIKIKSFGKQNKKTADHLILCFMFCLFFNYMVK